MTITNIISLLALIVAFYGAILSTILFFKEKLNLKLYYLNSNYFFFSKKDEVFCEDGYMVDRYYKNLYSLAIKVRISNNSKTSTTINEFLLNKSFKLELSSNPDSLIPTSFSKCGNYLTYETYEKVNLLKPLISLKPYGSLEGFLIFENINKIPSKIKISINTVQKNKSFNLKLNINDCSKKLK